jgi:hypothetical protein
VDELAGKANSQRRQRHYDRRLLRLRKPDVNVFKPVLQPPIQPVVARIEILTDGIDRLSRHLAQLANRSARRAHSLGILCLCVRSNR